MLEFVFLLLGAVVLLIAVWIMTKYEMLAKHVAIGIMSVPVVPLLIYGIRSHDAGKALICLITAAMYGGIMYAIFGRR